MKKIIVLSAIISVFSIYVFAGNNRFIGISNSKTAEVNNLVSICDYYIEIIWPLIKELDSLIIDAYDLVDSEIVASGKMSLAQRDELDKLVTYFKQLKKDDVQVAKIKILTIIIANLDPDIYNADEVITGLNNNFWYLQSLKKRLEKELLETNIEVTEIIHGL